MGIIGLIVVVVVLFLQLLAANKMQEIAEQKGSNERYWAWCFWLPVIGYAMVIALPDERTHKNQEKIVALLTEIKDQGAANVSNKHSLIDAKKQSQSKTGISMEGDAFEGQDLAAKGLTRCPKCGAVQTNKRETCYQCDTLLV